MKNTPKFKTAKEAQELLETHVAYLNRMIRQHKENPNAVCWLSTKDTIETEFLGYIVEWER